MSRPRLSIVRRSAASSVAPASSSPVLRPRPGPNPHARPVDAISLSSIRSPPPSPTPRPRVTVSSTLRVRGMDDEEAALEQELAELERQERLMALRLKVAEKKKSAAASQRRLRAIEAETQQLLTAPVTSNETRPTSRSATRPATRTRAPPRQLDVSEDEDEEKEDGSPAAEQAPRLQLSNRNLDADEDLTALSYDVNRFPLLDENSIGEIAARALGVAGEIDAYQLILAWHSQNEHGNNRADKDIISLVELGDEAALDRVKKTLSARMRNKHAASSGGIWLLTAIEVMGE